MTTTLPERAAAERLAAALVEGRWATEWYCHLKTTAALVPGLAARLRELHPYETPEIVAVAIVDGDPDYLRWIVESVGDPVAP